MKTSMISAAVALCLAACAPSGPSSDAGADARSPDSGDASGDDVIDSGAPQDSSAGPDVVAPDAGDGGACSSYVGEPTWGAQLVVEPGARLCAVSAGQWNSVDPMETPEQMRRRSMREMIARKGTIQIPPGTYRLPTMDESRAFLLPMCVSDGDGSSPVAGAASRVSAVRFEGGIGRDDGFYVEADFALGADRLITTVARPLSSATTATLSAAPVASHAQGVNARRSNNALYVSCAIAPNTCNNLTVPGVGTLRVDEYRWASSPGLGLAIPLRLRATIDGATIDLTSYESMTGVYGHHAFERSYFFRFASPVRGACGVRVDLDFDGATVQWTSCDSTPMGSPIASTAAMVSCT